MRLGAAIPSQLSHSLACLWDQLDPPERPYVTFRFYYRPRREHVFILVATTFSTNHSLTSGRAETLQTQGIIPFDDYLSTSSNKSFSPVPTRNTSTTKHRLESPDDIYIAGRRKRLKLEEPPSFSSTVRWYFETHTAYFSYSHIHYHTDEQAESSQMPADNAIQIPSLPSIGVRQGSEEDSSEISIRIRTLEVSLTLPSTGCPYIISHLTSPYFSEHHSKCPSRNRPTPRDTTHIEGSRS